MGKPGDWICPSCGDLVFASKNTCKMCGAPKDENSVATSSGPSVPGSYGAARREAMEAAQQQQQQQLQQPDAGLAAQIQAAQIQQAAQLHQAAGDAAGME